MERLRNLSSSLRAARRQQLGIGTARTRTRVVYGPHEASANAQMSTTVTSKRVVIERRVTDLEKLEREV
jgi:hypothetical protein